MKKPQPAAMPAPHFDLEEQDIAPSNLLREDTAPEYDFFAGLAGKSDTAPLPQVEKQKKNIAVQPELPIQEEPEKKCPRSRRRRSRQ